MRASAWIVNERGKKSEIRNSKSETNPNSEVRILSLFRALDFEFRTSLLALVGDFQHKPLMSSVAKVVVHESQFPENVRRDLLGSLRTGEVNHKFHYDSVKQTQKWLALHEAYSPSRTDPDCAAIYDRSFEAMAKRIDAKRVQVVGLGCGGGQKDTRLLKLLRKRAKEVCYTPSDVSMAMVLVARQTALEVVPEENCYPLVCDLATAEDLPEVLGKLAVPETERIITFFGMIPNFEPQVILPKLSGLLRLKDVLLFSANLAPGGDYAAGVRKIMPLYDNALTRDWLMTFLLDLGVEPKDGEMAFGIEDVPPMEAGEHWANRKTVATRGAVRTPRPTSAMGPAIKRVAAYFRFSREKEVWIENERFRFGTEKPIRLFFSYRHTPMIVRSLLGNYGLKVVDEWIPKSEEEGVFLCKCNESE